MLRATRNAPDQRVIISWVTEEACQSGSKRTEALKGVRVRGMVEFFGARSKSPRNVYEVTESR
jgi:hypothetical protein